MKNNAHVKNDLSLNEATSLVLPEPGIGTVQGQQLGMAALLNNATRIQHNNTIKVHDRRQAMRDGDDRATIHEFEQGVLDQVFRLAIE